MSKPTLTPIERQRRAIARRIKALIMPSYQSISTPQAAKAKPASGVNASI